MVAIAPARADVVRKSRQFGRHSGGGTLPLFADLPASSPALGTESAGGGANPQGHLLAAQRLARGMRRLPERSSRQTRAGQAICRHLIALLQEQG